MSDYNRQEWIELMRKCYEGIHDEFTAIRLANQFVDEFEAAALESSDKAEFIQKFLNNFGSKLGIDEAEIKRQQVSFRHLLGGETK